MQSFFSMRILLWLFVLVVAGCQGPPKDLGCLRICFTKDPATLDPRKSSDYASSTLICLLFEGLTRCKGGSDLEMGIAQKVEISNDGKTYLFFLRKANWSDGHPITAKDFEQSWKNILTPGFPAPCAYLLYPIKNAEKRAKNKCSEEEVGIYALNEYTLKVELEAPTPHFLSLTAFPLLLPYPYHTNESPHLICNGPFTVERMQLGSEILLEKNKGFWDSQKILLEKIHISIIPDETTALNLFEKGELDLIGGPLMPIPLDSITRALKKGVENMPMEASTFCTMNTKTLPFSNESIRKAFSLSLRNHPMLIREIKEMGQIQALHILPPTMSLSKGSYLEEDAKQALLQGLEEIGKPLGEISFYYKSAPTEKKIAQTLQKIWEEKLGVSVKLKQLDIKTLTQRLYAKNYDLALSSWIAQVHDPINILERFKDEENPKNYASWESNRYKQLLEDAVSSVEKRAFYLEKAQAQLEEHVPIIPLYHWNFPLLVGPRIKMPPTTSSGGILFEKTVIGSESLSQRD